MTIAQEHNEKRDKSLKSGFTFIELVIALAILGVLAVVIGGNLFRFLRESKIRQTQTTLSTLKTSITAYYAAVGKYPTSLTDLVRKPADVPLTKWIEPFIDGQEVPKDAYNNEFVYKVTPKGAHPYELYSYGAEGPGSDAEGMISVWG
jgi:general secretion pathway protein G